MARPAPPRRHDGRDDEGPPVRRAEAPGRACGARPTGEGREPAVRDDLAPGEGPRREEQLALERTEPRLVHAHIVVRNRRAPEVGGETPAQIRHESVTVP